jgi:pimeloyl-ACP methyl ester carboxylesterase
MTARRSWLCAGLAEVDRADSRFGVGSGAGGSVGGGGLCGRPGRAGWRWRWFLAANRIFVCGFSRPRLRRRVRVGGLRVGTCARSRGRHPIIRRYRRGPCIRARCKTLQPHVEHHNVTLYGWGMGNTSTAVALVVHPDGDLKDICLDAADTLDLLYDEIGCRTVDVVALTSTIDMWIDDEGMYTQPVNPIATALAQRYGFTWQPYHGPVVLRSRNGPETIGLTHAQLHALLTHLDDAAR